MKLAFTLLFVAAALVSSAQTKKASTKANPSAYRQSVQLQGLGGLKINKSTTLVIDELCKELHTRLQHVNSRLGLPENADSAGVFALDYRQLEDAAEMLDEAQACPASKVYYLPSYEVASLPIKGLYLTFYNDLLVRIELKEPGRFPEAFAVKYGKPQESYTSKPATCIYTHTGNKITYKDEHVTQSWYNGAITATSTIIRYYDSKCERQFGSYMVIQDEAKDIQVAKCSAAVVTSAEAKQTKAARKGLNDL